MAEQVTVIMTMTMTMTCKHTLHALQGGDYTMVLNFTGQYYLLLIKEDKYSKQVFYYVTMIIGTIRVEINSNCTLVHSPVAETARLSQVPKYGLEVL